MIELDQFYNLLKAEGGDFITGVPDTLLNDFCLGLDVAWPDAHHIIAANEGSAIALAAGYHLASGATPIVYMQNSGLGNALNPLISLVDPAVYSIPMVMLVGWRGEPGTSDWPQHQRQGELTPVLLDDLDIPYKVLEADQTKVGDAACWAMRTARATKRPTALLVRKGVLAKKEKAGFDTLGQPYALSREEAIRTILAAAPANCIYVASTGRITRELSAIRDELGQPHDQDFLNVGAMGHTLSITAGIALAQPDRSVICLDGDGAALMHLGALPVTAQLPLRNLIHVVLNNGAHESVGGQPTVGHDANLTAMAAASRYSTLQTCVETAEGLTQAIKKMLSADGPSFVEARILKGMRSDMPVLKMEPQREKIAFMQQLSEPQI